MDSNSDNPDNIGNPVPDRLNPGDPVPDRARPEGFAPPASPSHSGSPSLGGTPTARSAPAARSENDSAMPGAVSSPGAPEDAGAATAPRKVRWGLAAMGALAVMLFAVPLLRGPDGSSRTASTGGAGGPSASGSSCSAAKGAANLDFTLKDMKGVNVRLSDFNGKVIILNFWATWCGPCKVEIPEFVDVYEQYRDRGLVILGVLAMDDPSAEELAAFANQYRMNYPVFRANEDFEDAHGPLWGLPTTFIIDRTGAICTKHMGPVTREMVEREIKALL